MEKELTKEKYVAFMSKLTGHTNSFIEKNMKIDEYMDCYTFTAGALQYDTWIADRRIYTQYFLNSTCQGSWYHDFETLEYDWKYTEEQQDIERKEMIEDAIANYQMSKN